MIARTNRATLLRRTAALCSLALPLFLSTAASAQSYTLKTLVEFNNTNGFSPQAGLTLDSHGNLYGTTMGGGTDYDGTVFKIAAGSNTVTTLVNFDDTNGMYPEAGLTLDSSGNLYGTTYYGGNDGYGTVFKIAAGSNTLTTLTNFNATNGEDPNAGLTLDSNGNLYGTTKAGGTDQDGTVFKIAAGSNTLTTLVTFNDTNGATPIAGLTLDNNGDLYGTTQGGLPNQYGTVFKIAAGSNTLTTLVTFNGTNGAQPDGSLIRDSMGNLYGTTLTGGTGQGQNGTVFKIAAGTNTLTTLVNFDGSNGANPVAGLTLDSMGNLYGTTSSGGEAGYGTVFKIAAGSNTLTTLTNFNLTNGAGPLAGVILDSDGNLYGTTSYGTLSGDGTVFELSPTTVTVPETGTLVLLVLLLPLVGGIGARQNVATRKAGTRSITTPIAIPL